MPVDSRCQDASSCRVAYLTWWGCGLSLIESLTPSMHAADGESCTSEPAALPEAAQGCAQEPLQQQQSGPGSDGGKRGGIAKLRQVLTNILPGGSKSPGMSVDASGELEDSLAPPRAASLPKSVAAAVPASQERASADWQPSSPEGSHASLTGIKASRTQAPVTQRALEQLVDLLSALRSCS